MPNIPERCSSTVYAFIGCSPLIVLRRILTAMVIVVPSLFGHSAFADSDTPGKTIAGWVEKIRILDDEYQLKAKLDSGAKTASIHAINIEHFERDGDTWVRFDVIIDDDDDKPEYKTVERPRAGRVKIKKHEAGWDRRPIVELPMCFDGRRHSVEFTLTDRSRFIYPVLLGRKFLADIAVIDPAMTFLTQAHCGNDN